MSIKIICDDCGRVLYSAAATNLLAGGYRCPCGAVPRAEEPRKDPPADTANGSGEEADGPNA